MGHGPGGCNRAGPPMDDVCSLRHAQQASGEQAVRRSDAAPTVPSDVRRRLDPRENGLLMPIPSAAALE
jgi:hypothetical protein